MTTKTPAIETYREALAELENAVNALDQAHGMLKDIDWHRYISSGVYHRLSIAVDVVDALLRDLQNVKCEECGKPMGDVEACQSGHCPEVCGGN